MQIPTFMSCTHIMVGKILIRLCSHLQHLAFASCKCDRLPTGTSSITRSLWVRAKKKLFGPDLGFERGGLCSEHCNKRGLLPELLVLRAELPHLPILSRRGAPEL